MIASATRGGEAIGETRDLPVGTIKVPAMTATPGGETSRCRDIAPAVAQYRRVVTEGAPCLGWVRIAAYCRVRQLAVARADQRAPS
jgi:hypothetical protein